MEKTYIGIDNGVTGSIGIITNDNIVYFEKTPIKKEQSYTKKKQNITRINGYFLTGLLRFLSPKKNITPVFCLIERPMINPGRWKASMSAIRCLEATLIILEHLEIPFQYIDSKEWQKEMLPSGLKKEELKKASVDIGCRLFPRFKEMIIKHKDADSLLIAEYARRKGL
jgi:hypothetical protein